MKLVDRELMQKLDFKNPSVWIATWFGCGLMRPAPGTWGTLGGLPIGIMILLFGGWFALLVATIIVFVIGWKTSDVLEEMTQSHDNSIIVIDEVAGVWLTMLVALPNMVHVALAFLFFRFFDVLKPWPISWCDKKIGGGLGVMVDDIVAGIFAAIVLGGLRFAGVI